MSPPPDPAWVFLRSNHEGTLAADQEVEKTRFVVDGPSARLVFPVHPAALAAEELVLFVPEESPQRGPELQLLLTGTPLGADTEATDRWRAYHGEPRLPRWMAGEIESGKFEGRVIEPEALRVVNPLREVEPRLCKRLNADKAALTRLCERWAKLAVKEPLAVGIDPTGIDVRARFGIVHAPFAGPLWSGDEAARAVEAMLGGGP